MPDARPPFKFDLVSDLHVEYWDKPMDWDAVRVNDTVIVAGDVADTLAETVKELERLSKAYKTVLYIDGNHEFCEGVFASDGKDAGNFDDDLRVALSALPNVHFLKDGPIIVDGTAIIGRNGHWDYKALEGVSVKEGEEAVIEKLALPPEAAGLFSKQAKQDADDLKKLVRDLNDDPEVHSILVVTHTLPHKGLFPKRLKDAPAFFTNLGNSEMEDVVKEDTRGKIKLWVFGHWHGNRESIIDDIRYVSHPRGTPRKDKPPYAPLPLDVVPVSDLPPAPPPSQPKPPAP